MINAERGAQIHEEIRIIPTLVMPLEFTPFPKCLPTALQRVLDRLDLDDLPFVDRPMMFARWSFWV